MANEEVSAPLTQDEYSVLLIAAQGQRMIDMGEYSKWHVPLLSLQKRGMMTDDKFNSVITNAGLAAVNAREADDDRALVNVMNRVRDKIVPPMQPPGAYCVNGRLFFRLLDGSTSQCTCIAGEYAQAVVALWNAR